MHVSNLQARAGETAEPSSGAGATGVAGLTAIDNMHVLLWLIKDTCWLLEWRAFGTFMIAPTIAVAVMLALRSRGDRLFWINLAICCWITANSYWMLSEFFEFEQLKHYAGIPFACGFVAVAAFYLKPGPGRKGR